MNAATDVVVTARSMYERIGGADTVRSVVDRLYVLITEDERLRPYFDGVDLTGQKRHMAALLSQVLGGPKAYTGRDLRQAHASLHITTEHYALVGDYLTAALLIAHAPHDVVDAVGEVLSASRSQVVATSGAIREPAGRVG
ncbi:group I truncated hemoglobin [Planosporangium sp. 12N6]|uniref:group I truncated hemoglobin n=1 Tax=Planosporangium spinosum TaxID=3402278 RepID=UPI003CE6FABD